MIKDQKKLEELIYLSLIGKFDYKHDNGYNTYICFTSQNANPVSDVKSKPVYITNENVVGDKIAFKRLITFEDKVLDKTQAKHFANQKELNYTKRIKEYAKYVKNLSKEKQNKIKLHYQTNIMLLHSEHIINDLYFEAANSFVNCQLETKNDLTK